MKASNKVHSSEQAILNALATRSDTALPVFSARSGQRKATGKLIHTLAGAALLLAASGAYALQGERTVACVAINWEDGAELSASKCMNVAKDTAQFFNRNARGAFRLKPQGFSVDVPFPKANENLKKAEAIVKQQIKADYYIVPALWKNGGNHASGKIAHMVQLTKWVVHHEVGHLLGLGHAGQYVYNKDGVPRLENYGDADSPMGNNGSSYLNGPQYYKLGWLPKDEIAVYDPAVRVYELKKVSNFDGKGLTAVVIPRPTGNPAVVSYPISCNDCAALYLTNGGTQKVGVTKAEWKDENFTGIRLKILSSGAENVMVEISEEPKSE